MKTARFKTALLTLLVAVSLFLSYLLWQGNWQTNSEIGLSPMPTLPASASPTMKQVTQPVQIVVSGAAIGRLTAVSLGNPDYQDWLKRLQAVHLSGFHPVPRLPAKMLPVVEFDFGAMLDHRELMQWIPSLQSSSLSAQGERVLLYQTSAHGPVLLGIDSPAGGFVANTDIHGLQFADWVNTSLRGSAWDLWPGTSNSAIPAAGQTVPELQYQTTSPLMLSLVYSFFVNQQVLTRIQEGPASVIWTDGSRAVRWEQSNHQLVYEDPNASQGGTTGGGSLSQAVTYIRDHGGAVTGVNLLLDNFQSDGGTTNSFTFRGYVGGLPILDGSQDFEVQLDNGRVVRFRRPLLNLNSQIAHKEVHVLSATALADLIRKYEPYAAPSSFTVQMGYRVQPARNRTVWLLPVYQVSQDGVVMWTFDAQTGKVIHKLNL